MVYYIYFQDSSLVKDFPRENIITTNVMFSSYEIDENTCRKAFYDVSRNERSLYMKPQKKVPLFFISRMHPNDILAQLLVLRFMEICGKSL
jgi:hypothetical protein